MTIKDLGRKAPIDGANQTERRVGLGPCSLQRCPGTRRIEVWTGRDHQLSYAGKLLESYVQCRRWHRRKHFPAACGSYIIRIPQSITIAIKPCVKWFQAEG